MSIGWTRGVALAAVVSGGLTLALAGDASAHAGSGTIGGFAAGFAHPFAGLDHVLAMVAVGLWAARQGGPAVWAVPASFVVVMLVGGGLGLAGVMVPMTEQGITLSLLVLGVLVAAAVRLPLALGMALAGLCALCHGHAHGVEMPVTVSAVGFAAGFATATVALHATGLALAAVLPHPSLVRRWNFT